MPEITIAGRKIGGAAEPYMIAELSGNHNSDINRAFAIMEQAAHAGADAVKLQTYTADTITIDCDTEDFRISGGLWDGRSLHDLYQEAQTPWEWHEALFAKGRELGVAVFSSPFDATAVDLLESLDAPAYKIASFEIVDIPLIERVAATGKPLIMSTGMATLEEIDEAVRAAHAAGAKEIALLQCVSAYPAEPSDYNLKTIGHFIDEFGVVAGLSDHTLDTVTAVAAVALGAAIVEKHVTTLRSDGGPDSAFSLEPEELADLIKACRTAHRALGAVKTGVAEGEQANLQFRRSLYATADIKAGEALTPHNVRSIRPGYGLHPRNYRELIGRHAKHDVAFGTPLSWTLVD